MITQLDVLQMSRDDLCDVLKHELMPFGEHLLDRIREGVRVELLAIPALQYHGQHAASTTEPDIGRPVSAVAEHDEHPHPWTMRHLRSYTARREIEMFPQEYESLSTSPVARFSHQSDSAYRASEIKVSAKSGGEKIHPQSDNSASAVRPGGQLVSCLEETSTLQDVVPDKSSPVSQSNNDNLMFEITRSLHRNPEFSHRSSAVRFGDMADKNQWSRSRKMIAACVYNSKFDSCITALVFLNAAVIGLQTDHLARHSQESTPAGFKIIDRIFCVCFAAEITLRLYVLRCQFFRNAEWFWNGFDAFVIAMQIAEELISAVIESTKENEAASVAKSLRVLRVLRLIRIVRLLRVMRLINELRTLTTSICASMKSFFWFVFVLFILIYVFSVYLTQLILNERLAQGVALSHAAELQRYYGSLGITILSCFQSLVGGVSWNEIVTPLMKSISPVMGVVFSLYVAFTVLALMNIATGIFVETAHKKADDDRRVYMVKYAYELFKTLDMERTGVISWAEFAEQLNNDQVLEYFKEIDVDPAEAKCLFQILDINNNGQIDAMEFLSGCLRLRGPAKALDLLLVARELRRMFQKCTADIRHVSGHLSRLSASPSSIA